METSIYNTNAVSNELSFDKLNLQLGLKTKFLDSMIYNKSGNWVWAKDKGLVMSVNC